MTRQGGIAAITWFLGVGSILAPSTLLKFDSAFFGIPSFQAVLTIFFSTFSIVLLIASFVLAQKIGRSTEDKSFWDGARFFLPSAILLFFFFAFLFRGDAMGANSALNYAAIVCYLGFIAGARKTKVYFQVNFWVLGTVIFLLGGLFLMSVLTGAEYPNVDFTSTYAFAAILPALLIPSSGPRTVAVLSLVLGWSSLVYIGSTGLRGATLIAALVLVTQGLLFGRKRMSRLILFALQLIAVIGVWPFVIQRPIFRNGVLQPSARGTFFEAAVRDSEGNQSISFLGFGPGTARQRVLDSELGISVVNSSWTQLLVDYGYLGFGLMFLTLGVLFFLVLPSGGRFSDRSSLFTIGLVFAILLICGALADAVETVEIVLAVLTVLTFVKANECQKLVSRGCTENS